MTDEEMLAEIERLKRENLALEKEQGKLVSQFNKVLDKEKSNG